MHKQYARSLHVFRRDLRLHDNSALLAALESSAEVIPCFIFDKRQIEENDYKSDHCIEFMLHSLEDLNEALQLKNSKLYLFYGIAEEVIEELIATNAIDAVFINRDYTPFSIQRDKKIEAACQKLNKAFHSYADALLHESSEVLKPDNHPYTIFTYEFKRALQVPVNPPKKNTYSNYFNGKMATEDATIFTKLSKKSHPNLAVRGGRKEAIAILKNIKHITQYKQNRDIPALDCTTKLSAHNKFGTISIREFYTVVLNHFDIGHTLIAEMHWRDFFTHIAFQFPHVFTRAFHQKYVNIAWENNLSYFRAWREGRTGFPIVDAGMREMNVTGFMHNRVRMIVASFLTKDLHIDWRWGEKYFAQKLIDYDPAVNNGNWQWAASTGCDAQPYFRIFNPWLQQQKFDPECLYIKRWVPELSAIPNKTIHQLYKNSSLLMTNYPTPIVDHAVESKKAKLMYKI